MPKVKSSKVKNSLYTIFFMLIITIIFISILSFIYIYTKPMIELNEKIVLQKAILYSAGIKLPENKKEIEKIYNTQVKEISKNGNVIFYKVYNKDITTYSTKEAENYLICYVVPINGPGLWGEIKAVIAISKDLKQISGIEFIKQNETPGLGARISETWFKEQFRNKTPPLVLVPEKTSKGDKEIDAITGATRTSTFVLKLVNSNFENLIQLIKNNS